MIKKLINIFYSNIITIFNNVIKKKYHEDSKKNIHLNDNRFLNSVKKLKFNKKNDISDHFENIFYETFLIKPELILELGVRSGESTGIFIQVCEMINSDLISIDLEDCSNVIKSDKWKFIKYNSINFLQEYDTWSKSNGYNIPDVIFIDTSHLYEETLELQENLQRFPRNSLPIRIKNRCWKTGRSRGYYRDFGLSRHEVREMAHEGILPGVIKASW